MSDVLYATEGPLCRITLNRPDRRNAVHRPMATALRQAFERFEADAALRVAVLHGAGGHFCAGADLAAVADPALRNELDPQGGAHAPMGPTRMALSKPLIAAIEGYAVAGGLELALLADLRVADADATLGVFCRRWGVPLIDGGTVRLPRIVGRGRALDMILTGRSVTADEAQRIGLADRIVPDGEALGAAIKLAKQIAAFPQICMNSDRLSAYRQWDFDIEGALAHEARAGVAPLRDGAAAGAKRFTEGAGRGGSFAAFKGE